MPLAGGVDARRCLVLVLARESRLRQLQRTICDQIYIKGVSIKAMVELRERYSDVTSYCQ